MSLANENIGAQVGHVVLAAKVDRNTMTYLASGELVDTPELISLLPPQAEFVVREIYLPKQFDLQTGKLVPTGDPAKVATYTATGVTTDDDECPTELLLLKDYGHIPGPSREYLDLSEPGWDEK